MADLVTIEDALALVLDKAVPLPPETVPLAEAAGRFLAASARSVTDLPPFPSSAMDGFAIRSADVPGPLRIVGRIAAGRPALAALGRGEAMGIATGGVVPEGADAVVPIEDVLENDNIADVASPVQAGANVRPRGGDVHAGKDIVPAGRLLGPPQLAALAAAGVAVVRCGRRPKVTILATGSELRQPGEALQPGEIYESNGLMLEAAVRGAGAVVDRLVSVPDDEDAHRLALERGLAADVLVTSGGVSVGPHDLVRRLEEELGVIEVFWGVAMRPGKPLAFGVRGSTLVFGLPGNPVSSLVGCELFVLPAIRALQGALAPGPRFERGTLGRVVRRSAARDDLVRASIELSTDGMSVLWPVIGQESLLIPAISGCASSPRRQATGIAQRQEVSRVVQRDLLFKTTRRSLNEKNSA
ncbi:MAG: gephyrin-like molybdotransferase Glp, partial [Gaiellaceae bacterium]